MTIEERIVKLGLENNNFEKHAQESLKTLDRLDQGLQKFGSAVGFDKLGNMIDTVTHRFSALGIVGDQVIRNITNQVTHLVGEMGQLAKSMSIDQINVGFSKYGDKTQAVQTIMAATAKDWSDQEAQMEWVNGQLEKLNWFTDETSYSFLDMVNNIGKFTSNGIKLEDAVTAMEGISTWAAISGANVQEAGRAMYNLSQALATGSVKLMDWKSIENANMATREFKETALETAVQLGTLKKNADGTFTVIKEQADAAGEATTAASKKAEKAVKSFTVEQFNTELSSGWFSKDVLMKTLKAYGSFTDVLNEASEASGLTASKILDQIDAYKQGRSVVSDLLPYMKELTSAENDLGLRAFKAAQEAKTFADAINATKDAVSTGWMNIFEKMFGDYLTAKRFWTEVADSFYNIFAEPVNKLNDIFDIAFGGKLPSLKTNKRVKILEGYLDDAGKSGDDLKKAFEKIDKTRLDRLIKDYGSLEEAIARGAISAEELKKVLAELGIGPEAADEIEAAPAVVESFEEKLAKAGRSMDDFQRAFAEVDDKQLQSLIEKYGSLDEAIKQGAVSAETFKQVLQEMANDTSGGQVMDSTEALDAKIADYMAMAKKMLRGDYGNGAERKKAVEALGYDYDLLQNFMMGNLKGMPNMSVDFMKKLMKEYKPDKLKEFAKAVGYTDEQIAAMNDLLENSDEILEEIQKSAAAAAEEADRIALEDGAQAFRDGLMNILRTIEDVVTAIDEAFNIVFGGSEDADVAIESFAIRLNKLLVRFQQFTAELRLNEDEFKKFRDSVVGVFRVIQLLGNAIGKVTSIAWNLAKGALRIIVSAIHTVATSISSLYDRLDRSRSFIKFGEGLIIIFESLKNAAKIVLDTVKEVFDNSKISKKLEEFSLIKTIGDWLVVLAIKFDIMAHKFQRFMSKEETIEKIRNGTVKLLSVLKSVKDVILNIAGVVGPVLSTLWNAISNTVSKLTGFKSSMEGVEEGEGIFSKILGAMSKAITWIGNGLSKIKTAVQNAFGGDNGVGLTNVLSNLLKALLGFAAVKGIGKVFGGLGDLFGGIGSIGEFLKNPASLFTNFIDGLKEMFGITKQEGSFTKDLRNIAISIGILAVSLKLLSSIDPDSIAGAMGHMITLIAELVGTLKVLTYIAPGKQIAIAAGALVGIAAAMLILSAAMWVISKIDPERLTGAWEAMSLSLLTLAGVLSLISKIKINPKKLLAVGLALMGVAAAMLILSLALGLLSLIDGEKLTKAWEAMSLSLLSMVAALYLIGKAKISTGNLLAVGLAMIGIAAAMILVAAALYLFKGINFNEILTMATALMVLSVALGLLGKYANPVGMLAAGVAMVLVAAAMFIMAGAIWAIGKVIEKNADSMIYFAITLGVVTIALIALGAIGPVVLAAGAALLLAGVGFIALAAGMWVLSYALQNMQGLPLGKIALGLLALVIPLAALGVAGLIFGLGGPGLAIGGAGLLVLGVALGAFNNIHVNPDYLLGLGGALLALGIAGIVFGVGGLGLLIGAPGLKALGEALGPLSDGLKSFETVNWDEIGKAFTALAVAIGALFTLQFSVILDGVPVLKELAEAMPSVAAGFSSFDGLNAEAIALAGEGLSKAIGALFKLQFSTFADGVPVLKELSEAMPSVSSGFKAFEDLNPEAIALAGEGLGKAIGALFKLQFSTFADGVPVLASLAEIMPKVSTGFQSFENLKSEAIALAGEGLSKAIGALFKLEFATFADGTAALKSLSAIIPDLANGFQSFSILDPEMIKKAGDAINQSVKALFKLEFATIKDGTPQLQSLGEALPTIATGFNAFAGIDSKWLKEISKALSDALGDLSGGGFFSKKQDYSALVDLGNALSQFWAGLSNFVGTDMASPVAAISELLIQMQSEITNSLPAFETNSGQILLSMSNGIIASAAALTTAMGSVLMELSATFANYDGSWNIIGGNISIGLANGIYQEAYNVVNAVGELARVVQETIQSALDIHSPSRVMEEMGGFIDEGLSNGILDNSGIIEESMLVAINPALAALATLADEDLSISPVITPVVDMSNVNAAKGTLDDQLTWAIGSYGQQNDYNNWNSMQQTQDALLTAYKENQMFTTALRDQSQAAQSLWDTYAMRVDQAGAVVDERIQASGLPQEVTSISGKVDQLGAAIDNLMPNITVNVYAAEGQNANDIADAVMNRMQTAAVRRGAAYG